MKRCAVALLVLVSLVSGCTARRSTGGPLGFGLFHCKPGMGMIQPTGSERYQIWRQATGDPQWGEEEKPAIFIGN